MRIKVDDLKRAIDNIYVQYSVDANSVMDIDMQVDNPGEGKIGDIFTLTVGAKDGSSGLIIEVFGYSENRPPRSILTKLLQDKKS